MPGFFCSRTIINLAHHKSGVTAKHRPQFSFNFRINYGAKILYEISNFAVVM